MPIHYPLVVCKPFQWLFRNAACASDVLEIQNVGHGQPPESGWRLTISRRLALASAIVVLLVAGLCTFSYRATSGILKANDAVSQSLANATEVQSQATQIASWVQLLNNTQADLNRALGDMMVAMSENHPTIASFQGGGNDPLGELLSSPAIRQIRENVVNTAEAFTSLEAQHRELLATSQQIREVWQPRHDGLVEELNELKRSINNWNLKVANTIFIHSSMLDLLPEGLSDTPVEAFRAGALYREVAETFPALLTGVENAARTNEQLYAAAKKLSVLMLSGEWELVRKHYRDSFPFMIKSILVDIDQILAIEQQSLNAQHQAMQILNERLRLAANEVGHALTSVQKQVQQRANDQRAVVLDTSAEVLEKRREMASALVHLQRANLIVPFFVLLFAVIGSMMITRSVTRPLNLAVTKLGLIAEGEGDLTQKLPIYSGDEVGRLAGSFNRFIARQRDMIGRIRRVSTDLGNAAEKIGVAVAEVNSGALQQTSELQLSEEALRGIMADIGGIAESTNILVDSSRHCSSATLELGATIEEIAEQMEKLFMSVDLVSTSTQEMSASSLQIENNVQHLVVMSQQTTQAVSKLDERIAGIEQLAMQTDALAAEAAEDAGIGMAAVEKSLEGINSISAVVSQAGIVISDLSERSESIGQILTVIDDVADQTGLLALNATIIAAQAGERGKAFGVVADEIRNLAERTAHSTKEIAKIISGLQNSAGEAVEVIASGQKHAAEEVTRSREAARSLDKIRQSTSAARIQVKSIVKATHEQVGDSRQINVSSMEITQMLGHIATALQQLGTGIGQSARSTEMMREIAGRVKSSTEEQAAGSRHISENMENIRSMVQRIDEATHDQSGKSKQVVEAIARINHVARQTASRSHELEQVVARLAQQTTTLDGQVGAFVI